MTSGIIITGAPTTFSIVPSQHPICGVGCSSGIVAQSIGGGGGNGSDDDREGAAERMAEPESLGDHLLWQLHLSPLSERDRRIGAALIDALDEDGYLREPLSAIAETLLPETVAGEDEILRPVVYGLDALLLFVGIVNLVATLLLTTRERVRDLGMLGAVGMTPRQVTGSLVSEQAAVAALAGLVGLPLGLLFFRGAIALTGGEDEFAYPTWWSLALLVPALVALVVMLAAPLAKCYSRFSGWCSSIPR